MTEFRPLNPAKYPSVNMELASACKGLSDIGISEVFSWDSAIDLDAAGDRASSPTKPPSGFSDLDFTDSGLFDEIIGDPDECPFTPSESLISELPCPISSNLCSFSSMYSSVAPETVVPESNLDELLMVPESEIQEDAGKEPIFRKRRKISMELEPTDDLWRRDENVRKLISIFLPTVDWEVNLNFLCVYMLNTPSI